MLTADDVRQAVLAAVDRGAVPAGGPSEIAARDLLDDVPAGYWERWSEKAAVRIRAWVVRGTAA